MNINNTLATTEYTRLTCEDAWKFNAPHHFNVLNSNTGELIETVNFQEGPIKEYGINGVNNEDLIIMVLTRLEAFQHSDYNCPENAEAITALEEALTSLRSRTNARKARGVEGTSTI